MKTLREYLDQLDEISRRDFLKGAGAAAVTGLLPIKGKAEYSSYNLTSEDYQFIRFAMGVIYFGMYGKIRNKGIVRMTESVLSDLKRVASPTLDLITDAFIMEHFDKLRNDNPDSYKEIYGLAIDSEGPIRLLNGLKRIKDRYINGMSPQDKQRFADEVGQTIQMREEELEEASPDSVQRIEQLVKYK